MRAHTDEFYVGHGFDELTGAEADLTREFDETVHSVRERMSVAGNLYEPRLAADFPGTRCHLPINWLLMPDRKFDYVLLRASPGESFPLHVHGYGDEIYLVLAGRGTVFLEDQSHEAGPNDIFHIAPGVPHGFEAASDTDETFDIFVVNAPAVPARLRSRYWAVPAKSEGNGAA
jgi:quercetin dioxygenase-like cupin family protein